jgi:translocation and assembly module TamB
VPRADSSDEPRRPLRAWRWAALALACLTALLALATVATVVALHSLDRPWTKGRVQRLARTLAGVEIDYRVARVDVLSGVELEGLVVRSPREVQRFAPDLVRIGRIEARWSLGSILRGRGPTIQRLAVSDIALTVVVDEMGKTSFDYLSGSTAAPKTSSPTVPLSRRAASLLSTAPPVGEIDLEGIAIAMIRTDHGEVSERMDLEGVSLHLATSSAEPAARGWRVQAELGSVASPLDLGLSWARSGDKGETARAKFWVTVDVTSLALRVALDLRMVEQTFAANVSAGHWLHAEGSAQFDPSAGRTEVELVHAEAGDGAATAEALVDVSDAGDAIVRHAGGDIDLARLLRWLPAGIVPIQAERARVRYRVDSLEMAPMPRLAEGGTVAVDASVSNVTVSGSKGPLYVDTGELSLHAQPAAGGGLAGVVTARAGIASAGADLAGESSATAREAQLELRVTDLHPDVNNPLATRGDLALSFDVASLDMTHAGTRAMLEGLALRAHATLDGHAPYGLEIEAPASRLRVIRAGKVLVDAPARMAAQIHDAQPDPESAMGSRGAIHAEVDLGSLRASLDATKGADAVDFAMRAAAPSLKAIRPLLSRDWNDGASWDRMGVSVRSSGRVEHLGGANPTLRQVTVVDVDRFAIENVAANALSMTLQSHGTGLQHEGALELHARGLAVAGGNPSDDHVTLSVAVDRLRPSLQVRLVTEGLANTKLSGSLSFDPSRRAVPYTLEGHLAGLAPLAAFVAKVRGLDAFDLSELDIDLASRGVLLGLVAGVTRDGMVALEPRPLDTAAVEGTADVRVAHFRWAKGDNAVLTPALEWHGDLRASGARRTLDSEVKVGTVHLDLGDRDVDIHGITDNATVTATGSLDDPEIELTQRLSVRTVEQNVVPEVPMGDLAFALTAERSREGLVHISDMKVANGLGGAAFAASGNLDLSEGRRTLSITTSLTQDLARLSTIPERFKGRGQMAVEATVTSPDLALFHVRADAKGSDVSITLPRDGIDVDTANGEVPITVTLEVAKNGVELRHGENRSPYSMLRFADQHPLLSRSGFLSIARLKTPFVSIAPLVGNLEVEQNVISLRQFEMGVRGGTITGQCGIDWEGAKSSLELHVRANGVQSSHGEPFDGNIAVVISLADRTIDGRAEILRIGARHLLDLLDLQDPLHVDPAMNRIRGALSFGYPDNLRLIFDHGFASAHLELGGLARLISIGEIRGIPMGPIVDRMITHMLEAPEAKETP